MSHYITATIEKESIDFTLGTNHKTISAAADSGFDIYWLYNAFEYNNGISGSGDSVFVDYKIARNAYKHAVAWALALKQSYSGIFEKEIKEYEKTFEKLIYNEIFSRVELKRLTHDKLKLHEPLNDDEVERSISLLAPVLEFSLSVFEGTKNGDKVEISFC